jgi:hypothetical protein
MNVGSQLQSSWLTIQRHSASDMALRNSGAPYQPAVGGTVWRNWWFGEAPILRTVGRSIQSAWFRGLSRRGVLADRPMEQSEWRAGEIVWNWYFWSDTFTPLSKYSFRLSPGAYALVGEDAFLNRPGVFFLAAGGANYDYDSFDSHADTGLQGSPADYSEAGQDISFNIVHTNNPVVAAEALAYGYLGEAANFQITVAAHYALDSDHIPYIYVGEDADFRSVRGSIQSPIISTSTRLILGPKRVSETVAPPFDFTHMCFAGDVLSVTAVTVRLWSGVDPTPQNVYGGSSLVDGLVAYPVLTGGIAGAIYQLKVRASGTVSGDHELDAFLAVLPDGL